MPALLLTLLPILIPEIEKLIGLIVAQANPPAAGPSDVLQRATMFAQWHVKNFESSTASADEKRNMARAALTADLVREGLALETSVQNLVIEIAYNSLKAGAVPAGKEPTPGSAGGG